MHQELAGTRACNNVVYPSPNPHTHAHSTGRRGSYLFLSDADDDDQQPLRSRTSSMNSHIGDETYITPFAQVHSVCMYLSAGINLSLSVM